jgi:hypothetical protein
MGLKKERMEMRTSRLKVLEEDIGFDSKLLYYSKQEKSESNSIQEAQN